MGLQVLNKLFRPVFFALNVYVYTSTAIVPAYIYISDDFLAL